MKIVRFLTLSMFFIMTVNSVFGADFEKDIFSTLQGDLEITFIGHGTLMMKFNDKIIHIDPVTMFADYTTLPKADLILITHEHGDHLDAKTIAVLKKPSTEIMLTKTCANQLGEGTVLENGQSESVGNITIEAVPAYNLDKAFHPKGKGNGYVLTLGNKKVYVAGDTENIPEMKNLKDIDIAFLPMNLPYTMTPAMVADAARSFGPKILYPYHFGETNTNELLDLMKDEREIEIRIRKLK